MPTRIIVSGIIQNGDRILFGKKSQGAPPYPDVWHIPGGGVSDQAKAAALVARGDFDNPYLHEELTREIREEAALSVENIHSIIPEVRTAPRTGRSKNKDGVETDYVFLEYFCDYKNGTTTPGGDIAELEWVSREDIRERTLTPPSTELFAELGII